MTVNNQAPYRKDDYFRAELTVDNSAAPLWQGITNVAVIPQGTNADIVTNITGNVLVAKFNEPFFRDSDGNQLSDSLWTNTWNGENRLISTESASGVPNGGKGKQTWSHLADGRWHERVNVYGLSDNRRISTVDSLELTDLEKTPDDWSFPTHRWSQI